MTPVLPSDNLVIGGRYRLLGQVGKGGTSRVYRARDRLFGQDVALKRLMSDGASQLRSETSAHELRLLLAEEFRTLASIRHPHIISVMDYGFDIEGQPYFTMELLEGAKNIVEYGAGLPLVEQIHLLIQLLQALAYLHRRGIVHRDLKPSNVLIAPSGMGRQNGSRVKVLDLGLSIEAGSPSTFAGTLHYMAPEALLSSVVTAASDIYAAGIIAYEMFVGEPPFAGLDLNSLFNAIVNRPPDFERLEIPGAIQAVLAKMLSKDPHTRYKDARSVIKALARGIDYPYPLETEATRDSFLFAADFVDRENEFQLLDEALQSAIEGHGSAWLIGGESGVGKSRLVDELRTLALVKGCIVLRGLAVGDGASPFALWRHSIRRLLLETRIDPLSASVLKMLINDIERIVGYEVPGAPSIDSQAARTRLLTTVADLLQRQITPVVFILEDLQWAGDESLDLLTWITRSVATMPIMIVGNYRDDEAPALAERLTDMRLIRLERLREADIARLSESMLGAAGKRSAVLELLQRETEGNPFFVVEVIRVLAEEAGDLGEIGGMELPKRLRSGGHHLLIERRLNQVDSRSRSLLELAAVAGRRVDPDMMRIAAPEVDIDEWLVASANSAILEVRDERWQFAHDKLREGLLDKLTKKRRKELHGKVARALEELRPSAPEIAATLAFHWSKHGNRSKEKQYAVTAGDYALQSGANQEAITHLQRALALDMQEKGVATKLDAESRVQQARWMRQIGEAKLGLGNLADSRATLSEMLLLIGSPVPAVGISLIANIAKHVGIQLLHRVFKRYLFGRSSKTEYETFVEAVRSYQHLAEIFYFSNERLLTVNAGLKVVNMAERAGVSPELVRAYANMAVITGLIPWHRAARAYGKWSLEVSSQVDDLSARAWALLVVGTYLVGLGEWQEVEQLSEEARQICRSTGDWRIYGLSTGLLTVVPGYQGGIQASQDYYLEWYRVGVASNNIQHQMFGLLGQAENELPAGNTEAAARHVQEALRLVSEQGAASPETRTAEIRGYGILALIRARAEDFDQAREAARTALKLLAQLTSPTRVTMLLGISGLVETYMILQHKVHSKGDRESSAALRAEMQEAVQAMRKFARVFRVGLPRALLWEGCLQWEMGRKTRARNLWAKSLHWSDRLGMSLDTALTYREMGRRIEGQEGRKHLDKAADILKSLGAVGEITF